jgi:peptide/nickel transport system permease protein
VTVFIIRRVLQSIVVLAVMSLIVFFGVYAIGDPIELLVDPAADLATREAAIRSLGLDRPLWEQYFTFLWRALHLDLGNSFVMPMPAMRLILERLPATIELTFAALFIALGVGFPLGIIAGVWPKSLAGRTIMAGSILGFCLPSFWIALMFIMVFAVMLGWLPSTGRGETVEIFGTRWSFVTFDGLRHLILPAITLSLFKMSLVIRMTRAGLAEAMQTDYVKFARAKGLPKSRIVFVHAMKNTLIPIVTVIGLELGSLLAGAIVTESVFAWPGIGRLVIQSIYMLDRPVIVAYMLMTVFLFIVINLVVDIIYSLLDPRVRLTEQG